MRLTNQLALYSLLITASTGSSEEFQITVRVLGELGSPVTNMTASATIFVRHQPGEGSGQVIYRNVVSPTDVAGTAIIRDTSPVPAVAFGAKPSPNFYLGGRGRYNFTNSIAGRWLPWNPLVEVIVRPIINPVPMFARKAETRVAAPGRRYGFDLMRADWVAPEGRGQIADVFFELEGYARDITDYDSTLILTFTNAFDGVQEFKPVRNSAFVSPREAPLDGYRDRLEVRRARKPEQRSTEWSDDTTTDKYYFFRIRTKLDEDGKIKSALYGKIYGGFRFFGASAGGSFLTFKAYYLNPTPNDRNMEFDPKRNLFKNLGPLEQVRDP